MDSCRRRNNDELILIGYSADWSCPELSFGAQRERGCRCLQPNDVLLLTIGQQPILGVGVVKQKAVVWRALAVSLAVASPAWASTFKVGTGTGCTHSTIQDAVDAADANPGVDHIILTRSVSYTQQAIYIQQAQPLTLTGGYATCAAAAPAGERTVVNGSGGSANSVFNVEPGAADVLFDNLLIRGGDDSSSNYGGGIDFTGSGNLTLNNVTLTQNTAGYGGGLSARGNGPDATVIFFGDTIINNNHATQDGGGIHLRGTVTLYALEPNTAIWLNRATGVANPAQGIYHGYGGGMTVLGPAKAYIGSSGYGLGAIYGNTARAGGGIAALTDSGDGSAVYLFTTDPTKPQKVNGNRATDVGGAFYSDATAEPFAGPRGYIQLWDTTIEDNSAPIGSIAYLVGDSSPPPFSGEQGGFLTMNDMADSGFFARPAVGVPCNAGVVCSVVKNNRSEDAAGNPTNSALIYGVEKARVTIDNYRFTGNSARSLLDLTDIYGATVANTLIDNNIFTAAVLQFPEGDPNVKLNHLTITDNSIGGPGVIAHRGHVELNRSIIWQPGKTVRDTAASSGTFDGIQVLANESASIPGVSNLFYPFDPGFINPTLKDYRLRAGSEVIDSVPYTASLDGMLDLDGLPRSVNLPLVPANTSVDLGAYERQSINNIMVNDSFDSDLSQWTLPIPSVVSRNSDNGSGPSGSGSLRVDGTRSGGPASLTVARQCQVLPGPGLYKVTGWGRSLNATMFSPGDSLRVHWKVFKPTTPAYGCTGMVLDEDDVVIPAGTNWLVSPVAGQFGISFADYLSNAAVEISLVAIDINPPDLQGFRDFTVAFDGITLEANNDLIFANGFD